MHAIHEEKHTGCTIKIYQDEDSSNPMKEWDVFGKLICFHKNYDLGHAHKFSTPDEALEHFEETEAHYWPLYLMDHSGLSISMSKRQFQMCDSAGWDWGQVGWVYVTKDEILKEFSRKKITPKLMEKVYECIESTVNVYDQYLRGDVYGYVVKSEFSEQEESCWGFYGFDFCVEEAKNIAESIQTEALKTHLGKVKEWAKHKVPLEYRTPCPV